MLEFSEETSETALNGIKSLISSCWNEVGHGPLKDIEPEPNYEMYLALEKNQCVSCVIARENGEAVGYGSIFIYGMIHHKAIKTCFVDSIFLRKDKRKGMAGYRLIKAVRDCARKRGANKIVWEVTENCDFGPILKRMGYSLEAHKYSGSL